LDEVLVVAEGDADTRIQNWAMTWAMNPRPPQKMPNTQTRIVLEESVSMRDLFGRANEARSEKLRRLYLTMISRATYGDDKDDWEEVLDFYRTLRNDDERALVLRPLARENAARPFLWDALAGSEVLRKAAIRGFELLANRSRNSPEKIADFLLSKDAKELRGARASAVIQTLSHLRLAAGWRPTPGWDAALSQLLTEAQNAAFRAQVLTLLLVIDPDELVSGIKTRGALEGMSRRPEPRLYALLAALNPRFGIHVEMQAPEEATVTSVLAKLPAADAQRGRELFSKQLGGTACSACHRISGRGTNLGPDLSGIGLRSEPKTIIQSILDPSATITEGFQLQNFVMQDGSVVSGAILQESLAELRVVRSDGTVETIETRSVATRSKTNVSAMPTGFALLGSDQVADLAAFLATCRHGSTQP
jgi:putative heme-binding domain-containing protein